MGGRQTHRHNVRAALRRFTGGNLIYRRQWRPAHLFRLVIRRGGGGLGGRGLEKVGEGLKKVGEGGGRIGRDWERCGEVGGGGGRLGKVWGDGEDAVAGLMSRYASCIPKES